LLPSLPPWAPLAAEPAAAVVAAALPAAPAAWPAAVPALPVTPLGAAAPGDGAATGGDPEEVEGDPPDEKLRDSASPKRLPLQPLNNNSNSRALPDPVVERLRPLTGQGRRPLNCPRV